MLYVAALRPLMCSDPAEEEGEDEKAEESKGGHLQRSGHTSSQVAKNVHLLRVSCFYSAITAGVREMWAHVERQKTRINVNTFGNMFSNH